MTASPARRRHAGPGDGTWITRLDEGRSGLRVGIKDLIDLAGVPTTAGCEAVARGAQPARLDAACVSGLRAAIAGGRARLVGKTNLHELADGVTGINAWTGTAVNPLDPDAVPGGSSSGSAVGVGAGEADITFGTDTAGSVRIPAACCGVVGLKTTTGRISLAGVWPLAPSFDTIGPLARDVAGVVAGMDLLEPGFAASVPTGPIGGGIIGRIRLDHLGIDADPDIDAAIDLALVAAGLSAHDVRPIGWANASKAGLVMIGAESSAAHGALVSEHPDQIGPDVASAFAHAARLGHQQIRDARSALLRWRHEVGGLWMFRGSPVEALVLPTLGVTAPPVGPDAANRIGVRWTLPVSAAGLPALALPIRLPRTAGGPSLPASMQIIGRARSEAALCRLAAQIESATRS